MKKKSKNYRLLLLSFITLCLTSKTLLAQDTLFKKNGEMQLGRVLGVDSLGKTLEFQDKEGVRLIAIASLQKYTTNDLSSSWIKKSSFTTNNSSDDAVKKFAINRKYLKYKPSRFSVGFNFMSLTNPALVNDFDFFGRTYSTNRHLDSYFQIEFSEKFALRFPVRIGIKPLNGTIINPPNGFYGMYSRELIGDIGVEPIFYFKKNIHKLTWFGAPSLSIGLGKSVRRIIDSDTYTISYTNIENKTFYRIGFLVGFQYWFTEHLQYEMSYGYLVTNNYWVPTYDSTETVYNQDYLARNLRIALAYRF